jgi:hypothetical protein
MLANEDGMWINTVVPHLSMLSLSQDLALEQGIGQPHSKLRCLVSLDDDVGKEKGSVKHFVFCALMAALVGLATLWSTVVIDWACT